MGSRQARNLYARKMPLARREILIADFAARAYWVIIMAINQAIAKAKGVLAASASVAPGYEVIKPLIDDLQDPEVAKSLEFLRRLEVIATKYQFSIRDIILLLDPSQMDKLQLVSSGRVFEEPARPKSIRPLKIYINPHTGQRIETRGANHSVLKSWKLEYGAQVVNSWVQ